MVDAVVAVRRLEQQTYADVSAEERAQALRLTLVDLSRPDRTMIMNEPFAAFVDTVALVDHHVHGAWAGDGGEDRFGNALNEADTAPLADPRTSYDSQLGFAIRRWCAEPLELSPHIPMAAYWARRCELGEAEVSRRLLRAAGVSDWLIDTGFRSSELLDPAAMATVSRARSAEIVRLEVLAESGDHPDRRSGRRIRTRSPRRWPRLRSRRWAPRRYWPIAPASTSIWGGRPQLR